MKKSPLKNFFRIVPLVLLLSAVMFVSKTFAATTNVGFLVLNYAGDPPLFHEVNIAPGFNIIKTVSVTNTGQASHSLSIAVSGKLGELAKVLEIEPRDGDTHIPFWRKPIVDIAKDPASDLIFASIAPGQTKILEMAAYLPEDIGNEYQNKSTDAFDFVLTSEDEDNPSNNNSNSNFNANANTNSGAGDNTNGSAGSIALGNTSGSASSIARIGAGRILSLSNTNSSGVAESTNTNANPAVIQIGGDDDGQAEGAATNDQKWCFWWWVLLILLFLFLALYEYVTRKLRNIFYEFWPIFAGALVVVVHWILHDYYRPVKWCGWTFYLILIALVLLYYIVRLYIRKNTATTRKK